MVILSVLYGRVYFVITRFAALEEHTPRLLRLVSQLKFYPLAFICAWSPTIGLRFAQIIHPTLGSNYSYNIAVAVLRVAFLHPLFNAFAYGFNDAVISAWYNFFRDQRGKNFYSQIRAIVYLTASPVAAILWIPTGGIFPNNLVKSSENGRNNEKRPAILVISLLQPIRACC